ncbi:MAG: MATE family efflux transporter [Desulfobacteraceae bacterium]|nr:MAG: MATE family efflux transporter [Desulfobacteraceae bacterium]
MAHQPNQLTGEILHGPVLPLLLRLASPNVLAFLIQSSVSIAEIWYVGRLGTYSLAGLALVFPLFMLMHMMSAGSLGGAVASAVARAIGRGAIARGQAIIWHALVLALLGAAMFSTAYFGFGDAVLRALGGRAGVLVEAKSYAGVIFTGCALFWIANILASVYRGMGAMKYPAALMVLGVIIQIPLSGALILGWGPFPQIGIMGAAVSAVSSALIGSTLLLIPLIFGNPLVKLRVGSFRLELAIFKEILRVGLLASVSPILSVFSILCITGLVGRFGPAALAGYGIGTRLEFLLIPLIFGIGAALTSMVGVNMGAGKLARAVRIGWTGAATAGLLSGVVGAAVAVHPALWVGLYTHDPATFEVGAAYLRIVGSVYAFQGIGLALFFAYQGTGTVFWPVIATIVRVFVAVGGAAVAVLVLGWGITGLLFMTALGMLLYGVITALSVRLGAWGRGLTS